MRSQNAQEVMQELNRLPLERLRVYGRETELDTLHTAFRELDNTTDSSGQQRINLVTLSGLSGTGKSALVKEFRRQILRSNKNVLFVAGKFDQHQRSEPYHAFSSALTQLVSVFPSLPAADLEQVRKTIGKQYRLLLDLIPNLGDICSDSKLNDEDEDDPGAEEEEEEYNVVRSQARFKFVLFQFLKSVCLPQHKVVLFLDDLQWMDPASLDLLEMILMESALEKSMLIVGSYRDNEVSEEHDLMIRLQTIQDARKQQIRRIVLGNLSLQHTHELVTDLFNAEPVKTKGLAEIVHNKVEGNAFFLIQFLTALNDQGHLSYNVGKMQWTWEEAVVRKSTVVSNNVLVILMEKMKKLNDHVKRILTIVSFLGSSFEEIVVDILSSELAASKLLPPVDNSQESTHVTLDTLVQDRLLEFLPDPLGKKRKGMYCFAHDQIELAAHAFQDEDRLEEFKLGIARVLYARRGEFDFEFLFFAVVEMYNEGKEQIKSQQEIERLIDLNHQAGQKALESSAFAASTQYLRSSIALIPADRRWNTDYEKFLKLQNTLIKAEYSNCDWKNLANNIDIILKANNVPTLDKVTAYSLKITALSSHEKKHEDAISLTVESLKELGIVFRPGLGKLAVAGGLIKTKQLLKKIPMQSIIEQKEMDDVHKAVGMDLLTTANSSLYAANPDLYICTVLKIMRWSLKYGICKHTSRCLGLYGLVDFALGNVKSANEACYLALELAKNQNLMQSQYAPIAPVYGFVLPWTEPLPTCSKQLLRGYQIGLETGDLEYGMINICIYGFFCFSSGKPLSNLEADLRDFSKQMKQCGMELQRNFLCLTWQVVLNLMGRSDDPLSMNGEVMTQGAILQEAKEDNNPPLRVQLYCHQLQLAVYFGDFDLGASLLCHTKTIGSVNPANPIIWRTALFEGIVAFEMLRRGTTKWKSVGLKALANVKKFVRNGNVNCVHIFHFLQAEQESARGNVDQGRSLYNKAIVVAARNGFINDKALASERCGEMLDRVNDDFWAKDYFEKAHQAYTQLEAFGKIDHMQKTNKRLQPQMDLDRLKKEQAKPEQRDAGSTLDTESMTYLS